MAYPLDIAPWAVCQACTISSRRRYSAVDPSAMVRPEIVRRASVSRNRMRPHPWRAFRYPEGGHCVAGSDVHPSPRARLGGAVWCSGASTAEVGGSLGSGHLLGGALVVSSGGSVPAGS